MLASVRYRFGQPDVLRLEEVERPTPGAGELLIAVRAASANLGDWEVLTAEPLFIAVMANLMGGKPRVDPETPPDVGGLFKPVHKILGCDVAGVVEAVGPGVTRFSPGDEVFGMCSFGAFAEFVCVPDSSAMVRKPKGLSFEQAAALPQASFIAMQGLRDLAPVKAGQRVLVNGAGGGAGTLAVQLAKLWGAEVTGVDNAAKLDLMQSIGADHVVDYMHEDYTLTPQRYDTVFDLAAHRPLREGKRVLADDGMYVVAGGAFGPCLFAALLGPLVSKIGSRRLAFLMAEDKPEDLLQMAELVQQGKVRPIIDSTYSLAEVPTALEHMGRGRALGKVIITT